jgi:hypothetical protein
MAILKKSKYFIGGYEGNQLTPIVESLIQDAEREDRISELEEICREVIEALEIKYCGCGNLAANGGFCEECIDGYRGEDQDCP